MGKVKKDSLCWLNRRCLIQENVGRVVQARQFLGMQDCGGIMKPVWGVQCETELKCHTDMLGFSVWFYAKVASCPEDCLTPFDDPENKDEELTEKDREHSKVL